MKKQWMLSCFLVFASVLPVTLMAVSYDIAQANQELQEIRDYSLQETVSTHGLRNMQIRALNVHTQAMECVHVEKKQLDQIASMEQELAVLGTQYPNYQADQEYILAKKRRVTERMFNCRFTAMQAMDVEEHVAKRIETVASAETSVAGKPIYEAISGIFLTLGACLIFIAIVYLGNIIFDQAKLHNLSILPRQRFVEFVIFKFSLYALIAIWVVLRLLEWWGVPINLLDRFTKGLLSGGTIYGVHIIPMRLLLGIMAFAIIQIIWKYTLIVVAKKKKIDPEADSQIVLTSLLSYVVFTVAILVGLAISGVNFTGLAIVAGALTVGIGFGLQNIVNNFVSGIILLIEKTIKPGDRVSIKGYEGYVRKINLRFTRISTANKEDVLIPNSDLISTPIINFEFENKHYNIKCFVGVAYGSNLEQVRQILLNVALKHAEVLNDPINRPKVFINEFAESNILFELECTIIDVNRKHIVSSDLYFLIAGALRENNIAMSYPQRVVHLVQEK